MCVTYSGGTHPHPEPFIRQKQRVNSVALQPPAHENVGSCGECVRASQRTLAQLAVDLRTRWPVRVFAEEACVATHTAWEWRDAAYDEDDEVPDEQPGCSPMAGAVSDTLLSAGQARRARDVKALGLPWVAVLAMA